MIFPETRTEADWTSFLAANLDSLPRQAAGIRRSLLWWFSQSKATASEIASFWSQIAKAIERYAEELPQETGGERPDADTLTTDPHLTMVAGAFLEAPDGETHQHFLARVYAVTGLFKLFEAQRWASHSLAKAAAEAVIDAAILECEAGFALERGHRIVHTSDLEAKVAKSKVNQQKGGDITNIDNKKQRAAFLVEYEKYQQSLPKRAKMAAAMKALLKQKPDLRFGFEDDRTFYEWIRKHEQERKPKKLIEHL